MAVSSEKFEMDQDDLILLMERVESTFETIEKKKFKRDSEDFRRSSARIRSDLVEAKRLIEEMDTEARMAPTHYRSDMLFRVRQYREDLAKIQNTLRTINEGSVSVDIESDQSRHEHMNSEEAYRQQVLHGHSVLERTSQSINRSHQVAAETEQIGNEIVSDLGVQRETLSRARSRLLETNSEITRSRRVINRIYSGIVQNKIVLVIIIIVEIAILIALIYLKLFSK